MGLTRQVMLRLLCNSNKFGMSGVGTVSMSTTKMLPSNGWCMKLNFSNFGSALCSLNG